MKKFDRTIGLGVLGDVFVGIVKDGMWKGKRSTLDINQVLAVAFDYLHSNDKYFSLEYKGENYGDI